MWHLHKWGLWTPIENYVDVSWGDQVPSTTLARRCSRCGLVKTRELYGSTLPVRTPPGTAAI